MNSTTMPDPPATRDWLADLDARNAKHIAEERAALVKERAACLEPSKAELQAAKESEALGVKLTKIEEERRATVAARYAVEQRRSGLELSRRAQLRRIDTKLRQKALPEVGELRDWIEDELARTRKLNTSHRTEPGGVSSEGAYRLATHWTRYSIDRRHRYLVDAMRHRLPELELIPDPKDVRAECEAVKAGLPEIKMEALSPRRLV